MSAFNNTNSDYKSREIFGLKTENSPYQNYCIIKKFLDINDGGVWIVSKPGVYIVNNQINTGTSAILLFRGVTIVLENGSNALTGNIVTMGQTAFNPLGNTISLSATSTSSNTALYSEGNTLLIRNYGPNRAFVKRGLYDVVATVLDYPIEPYTVDYIYRDTGSHTNIAAVCANTGETALLSFNCGEGAQ